MKRTSAFLLSLLLLGAFALFSGARPAFADNQVVSDCGDSGGATQLRAKLTAAESSDNASGTITFNCTGTITLVNASLPDISGLITIDGGNKITLSGNNGFRILNVLAGSTLTLKNITLTNANTAGDGGALYNSGTLNVINSKFTNNTATSAYSGGAIFSIGPVTISGSEFSGNKAGNGAALTVFHSGGVGMVSTTSLHDNQATNTTSGWGGALLVFDGASLTLDTVSLNTNNAKMGGGVYVYQSGSLTNLTVKASTFTTNSGDSGGGAIDNDHGTTTLTNTALSTNSAGHGNGGAIFNAGTAMLTNVTLDANKAAFGGGGIDNDGTLTLTDVTLSKNTINDTGGGIFNDGTATLTNVTLSGNTSGFSGGGIQTSNGTTNMTNVTLSNNSASEGGAMDSYQSTYNLKNVLIAKGSQGANCFGVTGGSFNLSDDTSCAFGTARDNIALKLGALANNGGFTQTNLPQAGSPAIDQGTGSGCPSTDQRGFHRPQGIACDVGAVEVQPAAPTPTRTKTPLPTPTRTPLPTSTPVMCNGKPDAPNLAAPANGATSKKTRVTLSWNAVACAQKYKFVIKRDAKNGAKVDSTSTSALSYKSVTLPKAHTYYWFVKACKGTFGCAKSTVWSFTLR